MSEQDPSDPMVGMGGGEHSAGGEGIVALLRQFFSQLTPTGDAAFDGPALNAQVAMKIATNAVFTGGLRESLVALLRSPYDIDPFIRGALADALERGASGETREQSGLQFWKLQIVGLGEGKGTENNKGEQMRVRRRWGLIGQFMQSEIASDGMKHGARERAICAAREQFGISREAAEKSLRYFKKREEWVAEVAKILNTSFADVIHRNTTFELYRVEYDTLHVHHKDAPANRLAQMGKDRHP